MSSSSLELCPQPARPEHDPLDFVPLRGGLGEEFDGDAQIQLHVLCAKCKSLEQQLGDYSELENPTDDEEMIHDIKEHYQTLGQLRESSQRGCHLCTYIWYSLKTYNRLGDDDELWDASQHGALSIELHEDRKIKYLIPAFESRWSSTVRGDMVFIESSSLHWIPPSTIRALAISTKDVTRGSFYRRCADICDSSHMECHINKIDRLPTRLLHVEEIPGDTSTGTAHRVQLVTTKELPADTKYAALSYCWGKQNGLRLTKSNYQFLIVDIPYNQLPATIQDSVLVTIALGLQYVWVDALCIVQDSPEDWSHEASRMCDVYQGCSITLAASGASDSEDGLFAVRDPLRQTPCRLLSTMQAYILGNDPDKPSALDTRAWAVQEMLLPARSITFGSYLSWECRERSIDEFGRENSGLGQQQQLYSTILEPESTDPVDISKTLELWHRILERYSATNLSVKGDKLAAITGLGSAFERRTGWTLVFGLWEPFIIQDLLWYRHHWDHCDPTGLRPSWSWASQDGALKFDRCLPNGTSVAECVGIHPFKNSRLGLFSPAAIELNGAMVRIQMDRAARPRRAARSLRAEGWPNAISILTYYDLDDRPWKDGDMIIPLTARGDGIEGLHDLVHGLLIVPTADPTAFERVGYFEARVPRKHSEIEDAERFSEALKGGDGEPLARQRILLV